MIDNPLVPLDLQPVKDRILVEVSRVRGSSTDVPSLVQMEEHFNKAARVANKANVLAGAIARAADKYFIPVNPNALDVRAAVQRRSADSPDGLRISFDLFKDAVSASQKERKAMEEEVVLSASIEPASVLEKRIRKLQARISLETAGETPDDNLIELLVSQFIILYLAHELMKPFEGLLDHLPLSQTWQEKQEGGSEAQIMISVLIGLAIQMLIMKVNEDLMETYLEQAAGGSFPLGIRAKDIISRAKGLQQITGTRLANQYAGINDYSIILRYAFDYLEKTTESGYELWVAYVDSVQMRYVAQSMWVYAPFYSVPHALHATTKKKRKNGLKPQDNLDERRRLELEKSIIEGLFPMANSTWLARENVLDGMDDSLDLIAQVLSSDFAMEVACCLARFLGSVPIGTLKAMRALLYGLLRSYALDIGNMMQAIYAHLVSPNFSEIIALMAMHEVDKIFDKIIGKVLGLFDNKVEALLCCPFIDILIKAIFQIIDKLESELKGAIKIFVNQMVQSLGIGSKSINRRYEIQYDTRIIRKMISIIDSIIRAAEAMENCKKNNTHGLMPEEIRRSIQLPVITFEQAEKNYFADVLPRQLSDGKFLPAIGDEIRYIFTTAEKDALERINGKRICAELDNSAIEESAKAFGSP